MSAVQDTYQYIRRNEQLQMEINKSCFKPFSFEVYKKTPEEKLRLLANWLLEETSNIDSYSDGQLEQAIKIAKMEVKQEIGEYILEILNMSYREVLDEITGEED